MPQQFDTTDPAAKAHDDPQWRWKPLIETDDGTATGPATGNWVPRTSDPEEQMRLLAEAQGKPWPPEGA
jgi:hypothetical protein